MRVAFLAHAPETVAGAAFGRRLLHHSAQDLAARVGIQHEHRSGDLVIEVYLGASWPPIVAGADPAMGDRTLANGEAFVGGGW